LSFGGADIQGHRFLVAVGAQVVHGIRARVVAPRRVVAGDYATPARVSGE
jgi:hypothetical protein